MNTILGMLTPSSNTVLEPVTTAMLANLPNVSAHFSRFRVTEIALSGQALAQFENQELTTAADLLSDAHCQVIAWNGTSSGWLGFDADEKLCADIENKTGALACTSVLALNEVLKVTGVTKLGFVTPYQDDVQQSIINNYAKAGITCTSEQHLGLRENFAFAQTSAETILTMTRRVMDVNTEKRPEAIAIFCTNLRGAPLAAQLEEELGVPVYDTIATAVWKSLRLANINTKLVKGWGSLFSNI